jgi:hypothetical protein
MKAAALHLMQISFNNNKINLLVVSSGWNNETKTDWMVKNCFIATCTKMIKSQSQSI